MTTPTASTPGDEAERALSDERLRRIADQEMSCWEDYYDFDEIANLARRIEREARASAGPDAEVMRLLEEAKDTAIESGAFQSYAKVRDAFDKLRAALTSAAPAAAPAPAEPVAWIDPAFRPGKPYKPTSPVTTYEVQGWEPLYRATPLQVAAPAANQGDQA